MKNQIRPLITSIIVHVIIMLCLLEPTNSIYNKIGAMGKYAYMPSFIAYILWNLVGLYKSKQFAHFSVVALIVIGFFPLPYVYNECFHMHVDLSYYKDLQFIHAYMLFSIILLSCLRLKDSPK